ncbi:hypothetical protein PHMEG_00014715 [Phytophthora megakarya]|uniref:Uncharacterized protein n=1 Tax=Phytophthora megakarya TaxID=4795 RepID=A0A225W3L8_9STRA|nr:hypothetical protein PHMEG_00014715 [Phytophthora megakarya]
MARALIGFSPARIVWPTLVLRPPNLKFKMRIAMGGCMQSTLVETLPSREWNNGDISLAFREALSNPRLNRVTDSAFPSKQDMREGDLKRLLPSVSPSAKQLSGVFVRIRQVAQCGMGSVEKVLHRLAHPLPYDKSKRKMRLDNLFRLANHHVRAVEIS